MINMSQNKQVVNIPYRECKIMYEVDMKSVADMATHYGVDWADMKSALRQYGFVIRKHEVKPSDPEKSYTIVLTDEDKIVKESEVTLASSGVIGNNSGN